MEIFCCVHVNGFVWELVRRAQLNSSTCTFPGTQVVASDAEGLCELSVESMADILRSEWLVGAYPALPSHPRRQALPLNAP
jgi:hypothetical protein